MLILGSLFIINHMKPVIQGYKFVENGKLLNYYQKCKTSKPTIIK